MGRKLRPGTSRMTRLKSDVLQIEDLNVIANQFD